MRRNASLLLLTLAVVAVPVAARGQTVECPATESADPFAGLEEVMRANSCANNALAAAADQKREPETAAAVSALLEGAKFTGPWTPAEIDLVGRTLRTLPPSVLSTLRIGELRRAASASVGGQDIPNPAVYTPNGGGLLQVSNAAFGDGAEAGMVVLLHEMLHSTQFDASGKPRKPAADFMREETGWTFELASTGFLKREYRWTHDQRKIYQGPNYGDGFSVPNNGYEEMVAAMVDYVAAPNVLKREQPKMYERLRAKFFGGREYRCAD